MIDTSFLDELARFSLAVNKRVTSKYTGPRKSQIAGRGIIFKDHRVYAPGDDFRAIDWKIFARTDDLMVKTFEEERSLVVHIIIDTSSSMDFGKGISKYDYASMIGVGFAYLAMRNNEKFMFSTFAESLDVFQPRRGMSQLAAMVHYLNGKRPAGSSHMKEAILQYRRMIGSRALIVLVSDLLLDPEEVIESLNLLGNHDVRLIQVLDPVEKELRFTGDFKLQDAETKQVMRTFISPRDRTKYQNKLDGHIARIEKGCGMIGARFSSVTTATPIFDAFHTIL